MTLDERVLFGLVLAVGVIIPGFLNYAFAALGYNALGTVAWVVGYLTMALVVWYRWIRPLDLTGPVE